MCGSVFGSVISLLVPAAAAVPGAIPQPSACKNKEHIGLDSIFSRIFGLIFRIFSSIVDTVLVISIDLGISFLSLHFQIPYLKSSNINSKSMHSISLVLPYQKIVFRFGSLPRIRSLDKSRNPFSVVLVTGQSKKRCLKFSF
jgi:hypothetical protein